MCPLCSLKAVRLIIQTVKAVNAYQMTVKNGIICGGAVAPNYFCPVPSITTTNESIMGSVTNLVVRSTCGQNIFTNGNFYCQDNFVMDRDDSMIAMPIPIVKVCFRIFWITRSGSLKLKINKPPFNNWRSGPLSNDHKWHHWRHPARDSTAPTQRRFNHLAAADWVLQNRLWQWDACPCSIA